MKNKKIVWAIIIFIVIAAASFLPSLFKKNTITPPANDIILYFLKTCPHCIIVEEFIQTNKIEEKIAITKKDVSETNNASELIAKEKFCKLENIGSVPLLWDNTTSKCYLGDVDIINFLKEKTGM